MKSFGLFGSLQSASSQLSTSKQLIADSSQYQLDRQQSPQQPYSDHSSPQFSMVPDLSLLSISDFQTSQGYLRPSQVDCDSDYTSTYTPSHLDATNATDAKSMNIGELTKLLSMTTPISKKDIGISVAKGKCKSNTNSTPEEISRQVIVGLLDFIQVLPRQENTIGYESEIPGFHWTFAYPADGHSAKSAEKMAEEIFLLNSLRSPTFKVDFNQDITELDEMELDALVLAGYEFDPTDALTVARTCTPNCINILTWMRTKGKFNFFDEFHAWNGMGIINTIWEDDLSVGRQQQQEHVEKCVDLVFDHRHWTTEKDDIKFPVDFISCAAYSPNSTRMLEWFLNRGQYRYPMPQLTLTDRLNFAKDVKKLAERGKNGEAGAADLSLQLANFVNDNSDNSIAFLRTLPPPTSIRSNL